MCVITVLAARLYNQGQPHSHKINLFLCFIPLVNPIVGLYAVWFTASKRFETSEWCLAFKAWYYGGVAIKKQRNRRMKTTFKVGQKVRKESGKPFKSKEQINTITGFTINYQDPNRKVAATFAENDTVVNLDMLVSAE